MKNIALLMLALVCVPVSWAEEDPVLVRWRDLTITLSDYQSLLDAIPENDRFTFQLSMQRITELLNNILLTRTLAAEARQLGIDKNPRVQKELIISADKILARHRLEAFEAGLKVPDMQAAAEERYLVRSKDFAEPEAVRVSHVLVNAKSRSDEEARKRSEEIREKLLAGASIAELARTYSEDPSAKSNLGDLGFFTRGRMVKPFEDASFALTKPGDVSPVVKTQFGYHVIVLQERRSARQKPFSEVKDQLLADLRKSYVEQEKSRYAESITKDPGIVINEPELAKLKKEAPKNSRQ